MLSILEDFSPAEKSIYIFFFFLLQWNPLNMVTNAMDQKIWPY